MQTKNFFFLLFMGLLFFLNEVQSQEKSLTIVEKVDVIDVVAREPMLAEHPSGILFLCGYRNDSKVPQLWKSEDKGKNWSKVEVGSLAEGADGNSDVDLAIGLDGVIYFLSMKYTEVPLEDSTFDYNTMKGEHIAMGVSRDIGKTWEWTYLSHNDYDDRPWVALDSEKGVHVVWNDGKGVHYTRSLDQGTTWQKQPSIHPQGGSSHLSAGPDGQLALRITPACASGSAFHQGVDLIKISRDQGKTWQETSLPGTRDWHAELDKGTPRWVEPLAWDAQNRLYYLWSEGKELKLGMSQDDGQNWQTWTVAKSEQVLYFPYLSIKDEDIACTWLSGFEDSLRHHAAVLQIQADDLQIAQIAPQKLDIWAYYKETLGTGGEYFPLHRLSDGDFGMVTTIQNNWKNRWGFTWWRLRKK